MPFKRTMPSINALVTLEAAVRLKSFTAAAGELNVTQAAVSRQVRLLEDEFGLPLFRRGQRRVEPTAAGLTLGEALNEALSLVQEAVDAVRRPWAAETLTVGATLAVSHFWLLPRLPGFREGHPGLKIRVVSQDEPFDLRSSDLDMVLRFGIPPFEDGRVVASRGDEVFPMCSPAFASRLELPLAAADLAGLPLIGSDVPDPTWMRWSDWFRHVGLGRAPRPAIGFNHFMDTVAAALAGHGVALGWDLIAGDLVASGQLVCIGERIAAGASYNAVVPHRRAGSPAIDAFSDWIEAALARA